MRSLPSQYRHGSRITKDTWILFECVNQPLFSCVGDYWGMTKMTSLRERKWRSNHSIKSSLIQNVCRQLRCGFISPQSLESARHFHFARESTPSTPDSLPTVSSHRTLQFFFHWAFFELATACAAAICINVIIAKWTLRKRIRIPNIPTMIWKIHEIDANTLILLDDAPVNSHMNPF